MGFWPDDGENDSSTSASGRLLKNEITAMVWQIMIRLTKDRWGSASRLRMRLIVFSDKLAYLRITCMMASTDKNLIDIYEQKLIMN